VRIRIPYLLALTMGALGVFYGTSTQGLNASPTTSVTTLQNQQIELGTSGSTRLVSFYSPDCPISKRDVTSLGALDKEFGQRDVEGIAVAMPYDTAERIAEFNDQHKPAYHLAHDTDGSVANAFPNVRFTPTTFLIDSEGKIVWRHTGRMRMNEVKGKLTQTLGDK